IYSTRLARFQIPRKTPACILVRHGTPQRRTEASTPPNPWDHPPGNPVTKLTRTPRPEGLTKSSDSSGNLVNLYGKADNLACAHKLLDQMPVKNVVPRTCFIAGYTWNWLPDGSVDCFP
ncbi:hypothetical protein BHE74_00046582, partial [Ensete ventricosum]